MQVGGSQRVLVLVDHMHVDCSLLPQGVLHPVLHMLGDGRLVNRMVRVDGCGEDALAVTVGNLHRNNEKVHKDLKRKSHRGMIFIFVPLHVRQLATLRKKN